MLYYYYILYNIYFVIYIYIYLYTCYICIYTYVGKDPDTGRDWEQEEKGLTEDKTAGWHHWLNGHEFEQTQGDSEG